ncbi:MAG: NAD(P)/FAD-dependent oxidoreductase [Symploca sp. SIO1B1]|nr:NAD(P)/FAD-dependent oxidoreductase [Symploca sp. SIO1B1]
MVKITTDIVVIGSGVGGLSCAALLARYGYDVVVCESHSIPGGAAHGFSRQGFIFDSGPSLFSGLSSRPSPNPLAHVLDALGEDVPWLNYDTWGCAIPEGTFLTKVGADQFVEVLKELRSSQAVEEWRQLQQVMAPLGQAAIALPPAALRNDWQVVFSAARYLGAMLPHLPVVSTLTKSYAQVLKSTVSDPLICNWLDLLCFLLSGLPASGTLTAEIAFMFADWYRPGVQLDFPQGGTGTLVNALVRGLKKFGGELRLNAHVSEILIESSRAFGVTFKTGEVIRAKRAVISNASIWDTLKLLPLEHQTSPAVKQLHRERQNIPPCPSFMHLHLGIDGTDLPADLPCHFIVVNDWDLGIDAPQNVILVSIPSILDPSLAPTGKQVIHAYTPANEPFALWATLDRASEKYKQLKQQRSQALWQAIERYIPDVRSRCEVTLVGTPLTHARFLRRYQGSYGPAIAAGKAMFPSPSTPVPGLYCCGDSTFPGIGLPAVAASAFVTANSFASLSQHNALLEEVLS